MSLEPVPFLPDVNGPLDDIDCVCCDGNGIVDALCINPFANDVIEEGPKESGKMTMDDDDMMGMAMKGGAAPLMVFTVMQTIGYGMELFRWNDASKYSAYSAVSVTNWQNANSVDQWGHFALGSLTILLHLAAMVTEVSHDFFSYIMMGGHVVFLVSTILRSLNINSAYTILNDAAQSADHAEARAAIDAIKLEVAETMAMESMEMLLTFQAMEEEKMEGKMDAEMWEDKEGDELLVQF